MESSEGNTQQAYQNQSRKKQRPRLVFYSKEVTIHRTFIGAMLIAMIIKYVLYSRSHFEEIEDKVQLSPLSQYTQQYFAITVYRYNNDPQWEAYRKNLSVMVLIAIGYRSIIYLRKLLQRINKNKRPSEQTFFEECNGHIYVLSIMVILFTFRVDSVLYMSIIMVWWVLIRVMIKARDGWVTNQKNPLDSEHFVNLVRKTNSILIAALFAIMLLTLYLNERFDHFRQLSNSFSDLLPQFLEDLKIQYRAIHCSQLLNMTFLRLISYAVDILHEKDQEWLNRETQLKQKKLIQCSECFVEKDQNDNNERKERKVFLCPKGRDHVQPFEKDSFQWYLNYVLFTPTLFTGPPTSYRSFMSFQKHPSKPITVGSLAYLLFLVLVFEIYQILFPCMQPSFNSSPLQTVILSLFTLIFIWFKYLIIWRTTRGWALICGVDVVDNMGRCICNNYGFEGFWRMWHRGFNQWLVRYIYIPLGGNQNLAVSVPLVIAFVAFWHDHTLGILLWAAVLVTCMVPELFVKAYFRKHYSHLYPRQWFKYLCSVMAALYIYLLVICNLFGFGGYGIEEMFLFFDKIYSNISWFLFTIIVLASACILMFEQRNRQPSSKNY